MAPTWNRDGRYVYKQKQLSQWSVFATLLPVVSLLGGGSELQSGLVPLGFVLTAPEEGRGEGVCCWRRQAPRPSKRPRLVRSAPDAKWLELRVLGGHRGGFAAATATIGWQQ